MSKWQAGIASVVVDSYRSPQKFNGALSVALPGLICLIAQLRYILRGLK